MNVAVTAAVEDRRSSRPDPPLEPATLAYVLVRIGESFIVNDVITGSEPDLDKAAEVSRVLLHAAPVAPPDGDGLNGWIS